MLRTSAGNCSLPTLESVIWLGGNLGHDEGMALDLEASGSRIYDTKLAYNNTMGMEKFRQLGCFHQEFPRGTRFWQLCSKGQLANERTAFSTADILRHLLELQA